MKFTSRAPGEGCHGNGWPLSLWLTKSSPVHQMCGPLELLYGKLQHLVSGKFNCSIVNIYIYIGGYPYPTIANVDMLEFLQRGGRLEKPENCSDEMYVICVSHYKVVHFVLYSYSIMEECWCADPNDRPVFVTLKSKLESLLKAEIEVPYIDLLVDANQPYYNLIKEELFGAFSDADDDDIENQKVKYCITNTLFTSKSLGANKIFLPCSRCSRL